MSVAQVVSGLAVGFYKGWLFSLATLVLSPILIMSMGRFGKSIMAYMVGS